MSGEQVSGMVKLLAEIDRQRETTSLQITAANIAKNVSLEKAKKLADEGHTSEAIAVEQVGFQIASEILKLDITTKKK